MFSNSETNSKLTKSEQEKVLLSIDSETIDNPIHVYFRRWIVLFIYVMVSTLVSFNWLEYNIIQDVTIHFYNASLPEGETEINKLNI